ncbi:hypothetical protein DSM104329_00253 [Capillimicrobium parvum]|uniref:Methionine synthase n=2 Tax=Capillimicrobium parvum TaxID=2884022 RepID=A0A9E6XSG4_9ACTN|nr:hypothetical protein DSM104329_00253 [Capillimicrobium parvum]
MVDVAVDTAVGVHLVGGMKAADSETAMRLAARILSGHLYALPDGETGERNQWIAWQLDKLTGIEGIEHAGTKTMPAPENRAYAEMPALAVDASVTELPARSLGYADAAEESYAIFRRLREEGAVPPDVKFQVAVPTPYATVVAWVHEQDQERFFPVYAKAIAEEVKAIGRVVPANDLLLQFDVTLEVGVLTGAFVAAGRMGTMEFITGALRDALDAAPGVERGVHFCYGDLGHRHFTVPKDLSLCVQLGNAIADQIEFAHMPADRETGRSPGYYEPLRDLKVKRLALGVIDFEGEEQRTRELIEAAAKGSGGMRFAAATECGMSKIDERRAGAPSLEDLLALHARFAEPIR